jgi:hypothetical protein
MIVLPAVVAVIVAVALAEDAPDPVFCVTRLTAMTSPSG